MNFQQLKDILSTGGYYVWTLSMIRNRNRIQIGRFSRGSSDEDAAEASKKGPSAKTLKESLEQLEGHVKTYDMSEPGITFEITYQSSITAHGSSVLGPIDFTYLDQEPKPVDPPAPGLGYLQQPPAPAFGEQFGQMVQLMGLMNQNAPQASSQMQLLYQQRIEALDAKERELDKEKRQWRDDMREREADWHARKKTELDDHKEMLEERNKMKLDAEMEKVKLLEKQLADQIAEYKAKQAEIETKTHEFGQKFGKALDKAADWVLDDGEEAPPAKQQLSGAQGGNQMAAMTEALARDVFATNNPNRVRILGQMNQLLTQDAGLVDEINKLLEARHRATKPDAGDDDDDDDDED